MLSDPFKEYLEKNIRKLENPGQAAGLVQKKVYQAALKGYEKDPHLLEDYLKHRYCTFLDNDSVEGNVLKISIQSIMNKYIWCKSIDKDA
jgi:hypothetical protein